MLAGKGKWTKKWSGFGGKVEGNETFLRTAFREVLEELFNIHDRDDVVSAVIQTVRPQVVYRSDGYTLYRLPLKALEDKIIPVFWEFGLWIPASLESFIGGFRSTQEIEKVGLFSARDIQELKYVDVHFKKDLKAIGFY